MGCLFAARLELAGNDVALLDHDRERAKRINEQGISVSGVSGDYTVQIPTLCENVPFIPDFILVCVKSPDTREAGQGALPFAKPHTMVVTLQNGLGNMEVLQEAFGASRILGGVTAQGATLIGEGIIRHAGQGETVIGPKQKGDDAAQRLAAALNDAGLETHLADNVEELIWGKLIINVGINALTAITGIKNGMIPLVLSARNILKEAVREAVSVAEAKGIGLPYENPFTKTISVCEATKDNVASMLQDVLKERTTEVAMINGAIVREGGELEIPTPVNWVLTSLVQAIQDTYQERVVR